MARRTARSGAGARRGAAKEAPARQPRAKSKKPAAAEVEVVEEAGGEGLDTAIIVATTAALVAAIGFTDALLGRFDAGMFF